MKSREEMFLSELSRALEASGLSKSELSRRARIPQPMISRYFAGQVPRYDTVTKLADALGTTAGRLLGEDYSLTDESILISEPSPPDYLPHKSRFHPPVPAVTVNWCEQQAEQTSMEIHARLRQFCGSKRNIRLLLRRQIEARLDEFEKLCENPPEPHD